MIGTLFSVPEKLIKTEATGDSMKMFTLCLIVPPIFTKLLVLFSKLSVCCDEIETIARIHRACFDDKHDSEKLEKYKTGNLTGL